MAMDDGRDSRRTPGLDDQADGLDCFASECVVIDTADDGVVVTDTADDAGALVETHPALAAVRATPREILPDDNPGVLPGVRIVVPEVWRRSAYWPEAHVTTVAVVLFLVGLVGLWMTARGTRPVTRVAEVPRTQAEPARPIAQPVPEPSVARAVEPPRTAAPAATARTKAAVVPAPARRPSAPLETPSTAPAAPPEAIARSVVPSPAPAPALIVATPVVVRAEPAPDAPSAAAASLSAIVAPTDRSSIEHVLQAYRDAYDRLDAPSAAVIWPRVDTRALNRAFSTLVEQDVSFERCDLDIAGVKANAKCTGEIRYVQRVGDQTPRVRRLSWLFALERVSDRWQIAQVTAD